MMLWLPAMISIQAMSWSRRSTYQSPPQHRAWVDIVLVVIFRVRWAACTRPRPRVWCCGSESPPPPQHRAWVDIVMVVIFRVRWAAYIRPRPRVWCCGSESAPGLPRSERRHPRRQHRRQHRRRAAVPPAQCRRSLQQSPLRRLRGRVNMSPPQTIKFRFTVLSHCQQSCCVYFTGAVGGEF